MNRIILTGRLTKDLELKQTGTGKDIVNYSIAVSVDKDNTDFINCTTFGESAKTLCQYIHKGDLIGVEGQVRTSQYIDSENKKHTNTYVLTNRVEFLNTAKRENKEVVKSIEKIDMTINEEDLPF